ncbi:putative nucleotidyltransferase, ribonuclease H [Tanacetum coccineum]
MEERFDQLSDRMDQLMNRRGNRNVWGTDVEQSENPFGEDDDSSSDEQSGRRPRPNQRRIIGEVFEFKEVPENKRVSLIATKLRGRASAWWQHLKQIRERVGKPRITSWQKMKKCMRLIARNDIQETEDQLVSRYIGGLRVQIMDSVNMFDPMTLSDAYQRALAFEKQNRRVGSSSSPAITSASSLGNVASRFAPSQAKVGGGNIGPVSRASGSSGLKCFNCGEPGHRQSECKKAGKRHLFADLEGDDDAAYEEHEEAPVYNEEPECEEVYVSGDVGVNLMRSCLTPKADRDDWLMHNIFQSTCTISGKVCTFVCDSGSCDNLIAAEAVQRLGLKTENHLKPYKLQWLKKGGEFEDELEMGDDVFVLIGKEVAEDSEIPEAMIPYLRNFRMPHYRMSLREHEELRRQVEEFPIPRHDNLLDQISSATIFMKLDLKSGYYHIRLRPGDEWKTVFKTREGLYEWPFIGKFVVVYFDDILIYSASFNEHVTHVRQVLTLLRKDSFYAATKKCVFMTPKVLFLGYVVSGDSILVDESKVAAVQEWPTPTTITEVQSFHGLASFYRRFIPNFSSIMAPLTDCMKGKSFVWTKEAELAFQVAISGVLSQGGRPVAYFSEKLTEPKSRYTTYDLEFYAVIQAVKHWCHYLFHKEFVLFTDHDSLRNIRTKDKVDVPGLDVIRDMVTVDPYFSVVLQGVQVGEKPDFFMHDGFLFKGNQLCIPDSSLRLQIIKELHGEGHVGRDRTLQLLQASYFWSTMRKEADRYVKSEDVVVKVIMNDLDREELMDLEITYGVGETEICMSPELMYPEIIKEGAGPELICTGAGGDTGFGDERSMTEVLVKEQMKKLVG